MQAGMISYFEACRKMPREQRLMLAVLAACVALGNVKQPFPDIAPLHHVPTVLLIIAAPLLLVRFPLSNRSVASLVGFFLLHTLAGRYTYSFVPYDTWATALTGHSLSDTLGLKRNGFDRIVHFSFGLLWIAPISEVLRRYGNYGRRASIWTAFLFIGAASAAYEVFEWLLTMLVAPEMADDYNGQQGDVWDGQKDMAIAMFGGALSAIWLSFSAGHGTAKKAVPLAETEDHTSH